MAASFQIDTDATLNTNLVSFWNCDEETGTRADFYGVNGMVLGTEPNSVAGIIGNAADFDSASSEYLTAGDVAAMESAAFSVSFWINCSAQAAGNHAITSKVLGSAPGWWIGISGTAGDAQNKIWFYIEDSGGTNYLQRYGSTLSVTTD